MMILPKATKIIHVNKAKKQIIKCFCRNSGKKTCFLRRKNCRTTWAETRLKVHSVLFPREPRFLMQTWLPVCHYKTAISRLPAYATALNVCRHAAVQLTRLLYRPKLRPDNFAPLHGSCPASVADSQTAWVRTLLQRQFLKLHTSALQSLAVAGYQTACTRRLLQWQDTKLHVSVAASCSGRFSNCFIE
jgi:hypothetical protein